MMKRRMVLHIAAYLTAALLALPAAYVHAQVTPPSPSLMQGNGPLTEPDRQQLTIFVSHYLRQLATPASDAKADQAISDARNQLIRPTNGPVSAWWLNTYSQVLDAGLKNLLNESNSLHRVNALIIAGELGSDAGVTILLSRLSANSMPDRLWAANGLITAFRKADRGAISAASTVRAARDIARAAENETSPVVFRKQLQALAATQIAASIITGPAGQIRQIRIDLISTVLERLANENGPSGHLLAIYETLNLLRAEFLSMPNASQMQVGPALVRICQSTFEVAGAHWDAMHGQSATPEALSMRPRYGEILEFCESFVAFADDVVRGGTAQPQRPRAGLAQAWRAGNKQAFDQLRTAWRDFVLTVPQYRR